MEWKKYPSKIGDWKTFDKNNQVTGKRLTKII